MHVLNVRVHVCTCRDTRTCTNTCSRNIIHMHRTTHRRIRAYACAFMYVCVQLHRYMHAQHKCIQARTRGSPACVCACTHIVYVLKRLAGSLTLSRKHTCRYRKILSQPEPDTYAYEHMSTQYMGPMLCTHSLNGGVHVRIHTQAFFKCTSTQKKQANQNQIRIDTKTGKHGCRACVCAIRRYMHS